MVIGEAYTLLAVPVYMRYPAILLDTEGSQAKLTSPAKITEENKWMTTIKKSGDQWKFVILKDDIVFLTTDNCVANRDLIREK
jgi:hypothetical protein